MLCADAVCVNSCDVDKTPAVFSLSFILLWMGEPEKERNEKRSCMCIKIRDGKT